MDIFKRFSFRELYYSLNAVGSRVGMLPKKAFDMYKARPSFIVYNSGNGKRKCNKIRLPR